MPSNYVGVPTATEAPSSAPGANVAPTVTLPLDPDAFNAASHYQTYKVLADFIAWLTLHGAWDDLTNAFSGSNTFSGTTVFSTGIEVDGGSTLGPAITAANSTAPTNGTHMREVIRQPAKDGGGTAQPVCRIYAVGRWKWVFALNCAWDDAASQWNRVAVGNYACAFRIGLDSFSDASFAFSAQAQGDPDTWTDTTWVRQDQLKFHAAAGTLTMLLGTSLNAITLDDSGLSGAGATECSAGGYRTLVAGNGETIGYYGAFRKQFPATPSTVTYVATSESTNITNGGISTGYYVYSKDKNGIVVNALATTAGTFASFLTRWTAA